MKPFVVNSHRRLVFPSNFFPEPDFSSIDTVEDLADIVRRDFEVKAPTGSEIAARAESGGYANRYELLRDLGLHLFWMNRYVITMYEKRPTRWRDVRKVAAVEACYRQLPAAWSPEVEHELFGMLFDVFRHKRHHATDLPALKPTVAEAVATGSQLVYRLGSYEPDYPRVRGGRSSRRRPRASRARRTSDSGSPDSRATSVGVGAPRPPSQSTASEGDQPDHGPRDRPRVDCPLWIRITTPTAAPPSPSGGQERSDLARRDPAQNLDHARQRRLRHHRRGRAPTGGAPYESRASTSTIAPPSTPNPMIVTATTIASSHRTIRTSPARSPITTSILLVDTPVRGDGLGGGRPRTDRQDRGHEPER